MERSVDTLILMNFSFLFFLYNIILHYIIYKKIVYQRCKYIFNHEWIDLQIYL